MTYPAYEIDLRDGPLQMRAWMRAVKSARRKAREKPDDAAQHVAEARRCAQYAWDSRGRWMRARKVEAGAPA